MCGVLPRTCGTRILPICGRAAYIELTFCEPPSEITTWNVGVGMDAFSRQVAMTERLHGVGLGQLSVYPAHGTLATVLFVTFFVEVAVLRQLVLVKRRLDVAVETVARHAVQSNPGVGVHRFVQIPLPKCWTTRWSRCGCLSISS